MAKQKALLSFSGGLDTSAIIPWLRENQNTEVIAYCADLGNAPNAEYLSKWAAQLGALDFIFEDIQEKFVTDFVYPAVRAGAKYQEAYLLGTALGRPLIAERLVHYAEKHGATQVIHGATGKGNDQIRFENSIAYLAPELKIYAPWRSWKFSSRKELVQYLSTQGITYHDQDKLFSEDVNLFHRSCEGGTLEDLQAPISEGVLKWTKAENLPREPLQMSLDLVDGCVTALNGEKLAPHHILMKLNEIAGQYGVGAIDLVEDRMVGLKSRGVYETPGGTILHFALAKIKEISWDRTTHRIASNLSREYAELIYDGFWHSDARFSVEAFFEKACKPLTGKITLGVHAGYLECLRRESPYSLYNPALVSFEQDTTHLNARADGFCKMLAVRQQALGQRARKNLK